MSATLLLDRHVLGSGAALVDSGKDTFGWTAPLEGERAARLKNEVPWGVPTAGAADPPRLEGSPEQVLAPENYLRLHFAWLPLDGRMGFSMWGAVGEARAVWRILTHTVLLDEDAFRAVAGNPFALILPRVGGFWFRDLVRAGAFDERGPVDPIPLEPTPEVRRLCEAARRREIARLRAGLRTLVAPDELARRLAAVYASLSGARHVALALSGDRRSEMLIRLAWLSLPLDDRLRTWFSTEQGATAGALPRLMALEAAGWEGRFPEGTRFLGREVENAPEPSEGQRLWAADVALDDTLRAHARAHDARLSLLHGDGIARYAAFRRLRGSARGGAGRAQDVRDLASLQASGFLCRPGFAGFLLGGAARGGTAPPGEAADLLAEGLGRLPAVADGAPARGAVRALAAGSAADLQAAGLLRCAAVRLRLASEDSLTRLLEDGPEARLATPLLEHRDGPAALLLAVGGAADERVFDALEPLVAEALRRLAPRPSELQQLLEAFSLGSDRSAAWAIRLYEAAHDSAGYRPSAPVLDRLRPFARVEAVRRYLARADHLPVVLSPAFVEKAGVYIRTVRPEPIDLARALAAELQRRGMGTGGIDEGVVADALKYLASEPGDAERVLAFWANERAYADARLVLLAHVAWGPLRGRARAAAVGVIATAESGAGGAQPLAVSTVKWLLERSACAAPGGEGELIRAAVSFLSARGELNQVEPNVRAAIASHLEAQAAAPLALEVARAASASSGRGREAALELVLTLFASVLADGSSSLKERTLRNLLEVIPPATGFWSAAFERLSRSLLTRPEILTALAATLNDASRAPLASVVLKRAAPELRELTAEALKAVDRLAWTELRHLGRTSLDDLPPGDTLVRATLLIQLIGRPASFPLLPHLAGVLEGLAARSHPAIWMGSLSPQWVEALRRASPSTHRLLTAPEKEARKSVLFLPPGFRITEPALVEAAPAAAETETESPPQKRHHGNTRKRGGKRS